MIGDFVIGDSEIPDAKAVRVLATCEHGFRYKEALVKGEEGRRTPVNA